ncbi:MAG: hypothetical protein P4M09_28390 [Devosia sp.]|nr:hypothetical protein [Devosia sp.]
MGRSTTRIVSARKLARDPTIASVILRMMMALNDSALANAALSEWSHTEDRHKKFRARGARMYFSRMQLGHALEALDIVTEIRDSQHLSNAVARCDATTRASFDAVVKFIDSDDHKLLIKIRNALSFHYDKKLAKRAIQRIAKSEPNYVSPFTLGTEVLDWHFELADKVTNSIMLFDILKLSDADDYVGVSDEVLGRLWRMQQVFADFAGYFTREYTS